MSISDLFDSGFRKRNQNHFAAIVRVAMGDGVISDAEKKFLDRLAQNLDISEENYKEILKNYESHPINPPTSYDRRLERLYDLTRMVWIDHIENENQVKILVKLSVGLGFDPHHVKEITQKALGLIHKDADLDTFMDAIKKVNA